MFRITKDNGSIAYRTDLTPAARSAAAGQSGEPIPTVERATPGFYGVKSCSMVVDPERVCRPFREIDAAGGDRFGRRRSGRPMRILARRIRPHRPLPTRLQDLVIYELHVDGLGVGRNPRGMLDDAMALLDYLADLGINAVELLPLSEYEGWSSWGYGTSHYLAIEYAGGGRDQFKHFVKACHRRGIAVIFDVVYNHFTHDGERAEWAYDSDAPETQHLLLVRGPPTDYPKRQSSRHGGYLDNMSTGYAPRFWEETVRKMFISSAAALVTEFHIDGFRVDQTTSIHSYAVLHADGRRQTTRAS